ncbi:MAG TPA: hypothetical protein VN903_22880, partial [Polyangia bacterium]|nr:hypothetical protein [Polyangia bacterium]
MSATVRLCAAVAGVLLFASCSRDLANKGCNTGADCIDGYACIANRCVPKGAGGSIGGDGGAGHIGTLDASYDGGMSHMCPASPVTACSDPSSDCAEAFCGGQVWRRDLTKSVEVRYRIADPNQEFSPAYRAAIKATTNAWNRASANFVTFTECTPPCSGRYISVIPGHGDGISNPQEPGEQFLPLPVDGPVSPHWIAHQWGHVLGLSHTYQRADRDRYMGFDPEVWCAAGSSGLPPRCASGAANLPAHPAAMTGTFGVFDEKSKMNGFQREGICSAAEPDEDSGEPTIGDVSALAELFFGATSQWSQFQPIGRSVSDTQPLDYQLAPGVDPTGSPAVAELNYARPEIFVRGTDDRVYMTTRRENVASPTEQWNAWDPIAVDVDADPAVVFPLLGGNADTLFLAVRSKRDGQIRLGSRREGVWGDNLTSLGAPPAGAASAPALASLSPTDLWVFVRGGDGLIYKLACTNADEDCDGSAAQPDAWQPLKAAPDGGAFVGKPSAMWSLGSMTNVAVAAIRDDRTAWVVTGVDTGMPDWAPVKNISNVLAPDDPDPGVAIGYSGIAGDLTFLTRNKQGLLAVETLMSTFYSPGGVLASPPGAVTTIHNGVRTDVAAIIDDHGHPGVWWRYNDNTYAPPCDYDSPG